MRRPRVRFTTRRLMTLVALIAILLGSGEALRRRRDFALERVRDHEAAFLDMRELTRVYVDFRPFALSEDYHMAMMTKWQQAARRPWWPFVADPPPPDLTP